MSTSINANDAVTNPSHSTGPRTEAGKTRASRNATKHGLYAAHDFIREGEEEEYAETTINLIKELSPEGTLEDTFTAEIVGATWRLRRCRMVEEDFAGLGDFDLDPMVDERTEKAQRTVDRARAQSHNTLRRCIAELRRLQTDRAVRGELNCADVPILTDIGKVAHTLKSAGAANRESSNSKSPNTKSQNQSIDELQKMLGLSDAQLRAQYGDPSSFCKPAEPPAPAPAPKPTSFCKPAPAAPAAAKLTPRNALCPCGSGAKHKRCCGKHAPPVLNRAA